MPKYDEISDHDKPSIWWIYVCQCIYIYTRNIISTLNYKLILVGDTCPSKKESLWNSPLDKAYYVQARPKNDPKTSASQTKKTINTLFLKSLCIIGMQINLKGITYVE